MPNPLIISVPITQAPTTLYIAVDTYAGCTQQATIQPTSGGQPFVAQGNGEGTRIGFWTYQVESTGIYQFNVTVKYNDGSGFKDSAGVSTGSFATKSLNQTVVFSEGRHGQRRQRLASIRLCVSERRSGRASAAQTMEAVS
jgi:hypothetical protein